MKRIYLILLLLGSAGVYAQSLNWQRDLPSASQDFLSQVSLTFDQQYLISGSTINSNQNSSSSSHSTTNSSNSTSLYRGYDYHLVKLNQKGVPLWEKYFGGEGHDFLNAVVSTQEGGFLLVGTSYSSLGRDKREENFGGSDLWIIKVDEDGKEEWQRTIGSGLNEEAKSVAQLSDLSYVVAGNIDNHEKGFGGKDVLLTKLDKGGKTLSQVLLGGNALDDVQKITPTKDGGLLVGIYSRSGSSLSAVNHLSSTNNTSSFNKGTESSNKRAESSNLSIKDTYPKTGDHYGEGDYWVVKLDRNLKLQWQKTLGGSGEDRVKSIDFSDEGYIIAGESNSPASGNKRVPNKEGVDLWVVSLSEQGDERWQKSYSFKNKDVLMSLDVIRNYHQDSQNQVKGFLLGGFTEATGKIEKNDETFWVLYLDHKGEEVFRKYIQGKTKKREERLSDAKLTREGNFVLAGTSTQTFGQENWKVMQLADEELKNLVERKEIQVYPNPVKDYCYVEIGKDFKEANIELYDLSGKMIRKISTSNPVTKLSTSQLPQGIYLINITSPQFQKLNTKIIKQ